MDGRRPTLIPERHYPALEYRRVNEAEKVLVTDFWLIVMYHRHKGVICVRKKGRS
ncbi:hypothetical protein M404DRAFT_1003593 [Pisolithus tinctorius Marx 270]|uniref:Uncharacterized protein n=1 Tax=Pisolithus tinctorius Marx 270 TaxID=870435 RepID=A0A0C3NZ78_PISTI|nr:hypothetical protein M404DRAFT_1003593 [Pisolithus tinctorius Marx 270]